MEKNPQNDLVYPGERVDDLQNGLYVIQNPEKFCFGMVGGETGKLVPSDGMLRSCIGNHPCGKPGGSH